MYIEQSIVVDEDTRLIGRAHTQKSPNQLNKGLNTCIIKWSKKDNQMTTQQTIKWTAIDDKKDSRSLIKGLLETYSTSLQWLDSLMLHQHFQYGWSQHQRSSDLQKENRWTIQEKSDWQEGPLDRVWICFRPWNEESISHGTTEKNNNSHNLGNDNIKDQWSIIRAIDHSRANIPFQEPISELIGDKMDKSQLQHLFFFRAVQPLVCLHLAMKTEMDTLDWELMHEEPHCPMDKNS